jgi:hypothetical protein
MSLSSLVSTLPKYQITLPVTGTKVEYRPFLVKEEKILLMAAESKDEKSMNSAIKSVVEACTDGKVDISRLPTTDIEYLFLQLRSNSIGETVKPMVKCGECETPNEVEINLKEIVPAFNPKHTKKIHLISDIHVQMKYPTMADMEKIESKEDNIERALLLIVKCIDKVINGETIYSTAEMDTKEVKDFVENLTQSQFNKLLSFVETMPTLQKEVKFTCKKCSHENDMVLKGLSSFFS